MTNILAFDYGTRRIGVAFGNRKSGSAQGIDIVAVRDGHPDQAKIDELVREWSPDCFVVGFPFADSGSDKRLHDEITQFKNLLDGRYALPVYLANERLSSEEASNRMRSIDKRLSDRKKTELRNKIAAEIILETFLSQEDSPA